VSLEHFSGDVGKMRRMVARAVARRFGEVRYLVAQIHFGTGDAPVPMSTGPALLVKLQILGVARISLLAAPHLDSGARIASEKNNRSAPPVRRVRKIGTIEFLLRLLRRNLNRHRYSSRQQFVRSELRGRVDEVGIHVEKLNPIFGQDLLYTF